MTAKMSNVRSRTVQDAAFTKPPPSLRATSASGGQTEAKSAPWYDDRVKGFRGKARKA